MKVNTLTYTSTQTFCSHQFCNLSTEILIHTTPSLENNSILYLKGLISVSWCVLKDWCPYVWDFASNNKVKKSAGLQGAEDAKTSFENQICIIIFSTLKRR